MNPILSIDYTKIKYQCVYFIKFTSNHFDKELFKIGVTMNLNDRLKNLRQEFKIDGNYKLLLAIPVESDEIERDLLNAFEKRYPALKIDLNICNNKKTECFIYSDSLLESINTVKLEFCKQTSKKYIENVEVVARDRQDCANIDFETTEDMPWSLDVLHDSITEQLVCLERRRSEEKPSIDIQHINLISDDGKTISSKVINKNGVNYYKVSNWCKQIRGNTKRDYSKWKSTKKAKEQIEFAKQKLGIEEVEIEIKSDGVSRSIKGTYVYDTLAILIAIWIDVEFGFKIIDLVNQGIRREMSLKYQDKLNQKDGIINQLKLQLEEVLRDTKQVLRDNQVTHSKLDLVQEELVETKTELVEARTDREVISAKLDKVTDMISHLATKTS